MAIRKNPKDVVLDIVSRVGKHEALKILTNAEIGFSTADKLVRGKYHSEVGYLLSVAIDRAVEASKKRAS